MKQPTKEERLARDTTQRKDSSMEKPPGSLEYYSVDEVAETIAGITPETYQELWLLLSKADEAGTAKPLGGDGSNGTTEEPIISNGGYGSDLVAAWPHLSEASRKNIEECAPKEDT